MRRLALMLAAVMCMVCGARARAQVDVVLKGAVAHQGVAQLKHDARLSDAALAAGIEPNAYILGGAWLRPQNHRTQVRLKAGILYDINALRRAAMLHDDAAQTEALTQIRNWVAKLPVTGRQYALLAPRVIEATPADDPPVAPGDTLYYPTRPDSVRIVGAVQHPCQPAFRPLAGAGAYLEHCVVSPVAGRDWVWVIQPDGHMTKQGIALWNRSRPQPLAPGAVILVPIAQRLARSVDADLNGELAQFLATQPTGTPEATP